MSGKSARNEILKIRATYFNNMAVGVFVAGVAAPYFALFPKIADGSFSWVTAEWRVILFVSVSFIAGMAGSIQFHLRAKRILSDIED